MFTCLGRHLEVERKSALGSEPPRPHRADLAGSQGNLPDGLKEKLREDLLEKRTREGSTAVEKPGPGGGRATRAK